MENGRYFQGAVYQNAYEARLSEKYEPQYVSDEVPLALYYADNISEDDFTKSFECVEYDPVTKENKHFTSVFEWPYMPVREVGGLTYSLATCIYHFRMHSPGMIIKEENGDLLMAVYSHGFDTENGTVVYGRHYNLYFFRSTDCARTWKYVSQILSDPVYCPEVGDGFCEPNIILTPGGEYFILMRTGTNTPAYCAYSPDKGKTWENITWFSSVSVDPQLLQLDCGVCLASYGRPGVYLRATDDADCKSWSDEITILEPDKESDDYWKDSCCYTSLIPTGKNTALIAYSIFDYPDGEDADAMTKTIVVREITVVYP